jgi:hypothetical protein
MRRAILILALSISFPCFAKEHEWHLCKILSQNISSEREGVAALGLANAYGSSANGMAVAVPIYHTYNLLVIDNGGGRLSLVEVLKGRQRPLILPVNGTARCYEDRGLLVFEDSTGKKHKFQVIHMEAKQ